MTEAVASRYREVLPECFVVETRGPMLRVKAPGHSGLFFGNLILHIPLLPAKRRLEKFVEVAFGDLPRTVAHVSDIEPDVNWPALGTTCHWRVTRDEVHVWYGHSDQENEAVLTVRPFSRRELGI